MNNRYVRIGVASLVGIALCVLLVPILMRAYVDRFLYTSLPDVPRAQVAIVPGASVFAGEPSPILAARADAAIALFEAGKVSRILVSGDNSALNHDEVTPVRKYLVAAGIPPQAIFLDHAGFDTYSSMYRAKAIFGVTSAIVVTQDFHLPRALFLARSLGLQAYGYDAGGPSSFFDYLREIPAADKAILDLLMHRVPKFLGPAISLSGSGTVTWYDGAPACTLGTCPTDLSIADSGKTLIYRMTTRFEILLDDTQNPKADFSVSCSPQNTIGKISNVPAVASPQYYVRFEGVAPGVCTLSDSSFSVRIQIRDSR